MSKVVILSVPYIHPHPQVAPILLSACLNDAGITATAVDFNTLFLEKFIDNPHWIGVKNTFCIGYVYDFKLPRRLFLDILKFTKKFLNNLVITHNPEWIGLSIFTSESLDFSFIISYLIRRYYPHIKIIAGGKGLEVTSGLTTNSKKHYVNFIENGIADTVVVGDAESSIITVIKENITGIYESPQQTKEDLDLVPLPKYSDYDLTKYKKLENHPTLERIVQEPYFVVTGSKGCIRKCTFCDVESFWPKFIYRDPEKVANEIISYYRNTGIRNVEFTDNLINGSVTNYRRINEILAKEIPNEISYQGYAIFRGKHQMPEEDFDLAARAGCKRWSIGVESGSERVRFDMKKKFNNDDLDYSIQNLHRVGIKQIWLMIVGYPTETEEDFQQTLEMFKRHSHLAANKMITWVASPTLMLNENAPLFTNREIMKSHGLTHNVDLHLYQKFWTSTVNPENTFDVRIDRWYRLIEFADSLNYERHDAFVINKWVAEVDNLMKIYKETNAKNKIISRNI
jgi:hypothetical protein